jgi:hypothetical protein
MIAEAGQNLADSKDVSGQASLRVAVIGDVLEVRVRHCIEKRFVKVMFSDA